MLMKVFFCKNYYYLTWLFQIQISIFCVSGICSVLLLYVVRNFCLHISGTLLYLRRMQLANNLVYNKYSRCFNNILYGQENIHFELYSNCYTQPQQVHTVTGEGSERTFWFRNKHVITCSEVARKLGREKR